MKYDANIYRPPSEAYTLLLQVTSGCSHNDCTYCSMYKDVQFKTETLEQIERDLIEAKNYYPNETRIYLLNGDPFCLSSDRLTAIAKLIHKYFPKCDTISMYASIQSIRSKTMDELKQLRAHGINDLYIGLETGNDEALAHIRKGNTRAEAIEQLQRLNQAGIDFISILMYGVASHGKGIENAIDTAKLLNAVKSKVVALMSLTLIPGTELYREYLTGDFVEETGLEKLQELKALVENLNLKDETVFSSIHISNIVSLNGLLPNDKKLFLKRLDKTISEIVK